MKPKLLKYKYGDLWSSKKKEFEIKTEIRK